MTDAIMTLDIAAIKARADKATAGGWIVIETTHPYKFTPSRPEFKGEGFHVERRIATAWDHPQLKDKYPLVNIATGIGTPESGAVHMCSIEADDADFIAHARTDIPALIAALEASEAARVKAEQALRTVQNAAKTLAYSRDSELQHLRENGTYDHKLRAEHDSLIDRDALMTDRITALEQERDALKKALTAVRDDLQVRAVKNVVAVGVSVWIEVNTALEAKP